MKLIAAIMVKNESKRIIRTLQSLFENPKNPSDSSSSIRELIVLDTGSTDDTIELIIEYCEKINVKCIINNSEFTDYSTTRNLLLQHVSEYIYTCVGDDSIFNVLDNNTVKDVIEDDNYVLLLDSNDEAKNLSTLYTHLQTRLRSPNPKFEAPIIYTRFEIENTSTKLHFSYPRASCIKISPFIGTVEGVHYMYPVHEMLTYKNATPDKLDEYCDYTLVTSDFHIYQDRDKDESSEKRYKRDLELLIKYVNEHPDDLRSTYYVCQTASDLKDYKTLFLYALKTIAFCKKYPQEKGYIEYIYCGYMFAGLACHYLKQGQPICYFMKAFEYSKYTIPRCEPLYHIAVIYRELGNIELARKFSRLACSVPKPPTEKLKYIVLQSGIYDEERWRLANSLKNEVFSTFVGST